MTYMGGGVVGWVSGWVCVCVCRGGSRASSLNSNEVILFSWSFGKRSLSSFLEAITREEN